MVFRSGGGEVDEEREEALSSDTEVVLEGVEGDGPMRGKLVELSPAKEYVDYSQQGVVFTLMRSFAERVNR